MNRLRVVAALTEHEELCACQITELLHVSGATVSRHLSILQQSGLVCSRKEGRWVYFRLDDTNAVNLKTFALLGSELKVTSRAEIDRNRLNEITSIPPEVLCRKQKGEKCCPQSVQRVKR